MATVTDTLVTVFTLQGLPQMVAGFQAAETGARKFAAELVEVEAAFGTLAAAQAALATLLNPVALAIGAVAIAFLTAKKALDAFAQSEDSVGRLAIQMRNLGNSFSAADIVAFSQGLQQATGIAHTAIEPLAAMAIQFGLTRQQAEKLVPTVLDIATALKRAPEDVERVLLRASRGRPQGLVALGIDPTKIKGDLHDVNNLISQVGEGFQGTAAAFRNTLPGTVTALQSSVSSLFEALGRFISPVVVPLLNGLIAVINKATVLLQGLADVLHIPTAAALGEGPASKLAFKGDPEQTGALQEIAANTKTTADAIVQGVLGGPGTVARGAISVRDLQMAFRV